MTTTPSAGVGVTEGDSAKHSKHVRKKLLMSLFVLLMLCALSVAGWLFGRAGRVLCVCASIWVCSSLVVIVVYCLAGSGVVWLASELAIYSDRFASGPIST